MDALVQHLMSVYGLSPEDALKVAQGLGVAPPSPMSPPPQGPEYDAQMAMADLGYGKRPSAQSYVGPNVAPVVQKALHTGINKGLVNGAPPEDPWAAYERAHPIAAGAKKALVHAGRDEMLGLKVMGRNVRDAAGYVKDKVVGSSPGPLSDQYNSMHEKLSAKKMLEEYLKARDMERANAAQKDTLNSAIAQSQAADLFFTDNMRPPTSLGDFVNAGAGLAALPPAKVQ